MIRIKARVLIAAAIKTGLKQSEICEESSVSFVTWKKMKRGEMVQFPCIKRVCETLDLNPAEILEDVDENLPAQGPEKSLSPAQGEAHDAGHSQNVMGRRSVRRISG